jgi:hypothetical protein
MELKPTKGLKVRVNAEREAIFGDESVSVQKIKLNDQSRAGVMTGQTLAGFCEVEMHALDSHKHWYPVDDIFGEKGEKIVEEEIPIELDEEGDGVPEEEPS